MLERSYRNNKILNMVPKDVETVLDIGSRGNIFNVDYKTTTLDTLENADIKQDLNKTKILPFSDNSYDLVVVNQILEHLDTVEEVIDEIKRVSGKYIFLGLPNEMTWGARIKYLFGIIEEGGYCPYGHKHRFTISEIENFKRFFFDKEVKKEYLGAFTGAGFLPYRIRDFLAKRFPTLFCKEIYYLIQL